MNTNQNYLLYKNLYTFVINSLFITPDILFRNDAKIDIFVNFDLKFLSNETLKNFNNTLNDYPNNKLGIFRDYDILNIKLTIYKSFQPENSYMYGHIDTFLDSADKLRLIIVIPYDFSGIEDNDLVTLIVYIYETIFRYLSTSINCSKSFQKELFTNFAPYLMAFKTIYDTLKYNDLDVIKNSKICNNTFSPKLIDAILDNDDYYNIEKGGINIASLLDFGGIYSLYKELDKKDNKENESK